MDIIFNIRTAQEGPANPWSLFRDWLQTAQNTEPIDHNAMTLSTINTDNRPESRVVLLKNFDERGFVFFTNRLSRKGQALSAHPYAALCFYWKSLGAQIRIEGSVSLISEEESTVYFNSRPRGSRLGAWASLQSQPLDNRDVLTDRVAHYDKEFASEDVPKPPHWGGYRVIPHRIEFWHEGESRLHTRLVFTRRGDTESWDRMLLFP